MTFKDKTFCASPNCKNECGRKMTKKELEELKRLPVWCQDVSLGLFCGDMEIIEHRLKVVE